MINLAQRFQGYFQTLLTGVVGLGVPLVVVDQALAQEYGPRNFVPAPSGTNAISFRYLNIDSNTSIDSSIVYPQLDIDTDVFIFSYVRNFDIGVTSGQVVLTQPFAIADAGVSAGAFNISRDNLGIADTIAELRVGIVGAPAVNLQEYGELYFGENSPDFVMKGLVGVTFPTGEYSTERVVNLSSNRFAFKAALPTMINFGPNWAPGNRTILEVIPSANFYTSNNSPPFPNSRFGSNFTSQNPVFSLESHLSTDLGPKYFASIDTYYAFGGATSTDGGSNNNGQSWLGLGGTLGASPWTGGTLSVSYGGVVAGNNNSPNGSQFRFVLVQSF